MDADERTLWRLLARPRARVGIAAGGLVAALGGGLLLATSGHLVDPVAYGLQIATMIIGTVAAALVWIRRRPGNRVALLLLTLALAIAIAPLQGASGDVLHSLGVLADPAVLWLSYFVVFAFPEGRLKGRPERLILLGWALYCAVGFAPWFFFSPTITGGSPLADCTASCPANGLMIADRPTVAAGLGTGLSWLVIAVATATIALLVFRLVSASRPRRRALLPVYVAALMLTAPLLVFHGFAAGVLELDADTLSVTGWFVTIGRTALAFGFLLAIAQASVFAGTALERLMAQIGGGPHAARLRGVVADALDDPALELVFRVHGSDRYVDSHGEPIPAVTARDGRATSLVAQKGEAVGAIWHDPALNTDPELIRAASQAILLALDNGRLEVALALSRAQTAEAAGAARRKVERDLHDGAQQQLLALQIKVALTHELAEQDSEIAARLADVGDRLEDVVRELRDLARGVRPPLLRDFGLPAALASAAQRSRPPAALVADGIARYPDDVENAVYFCCLESLQNVGKHAGADARARVLVCEQADELWFEIVDDGVGCELEPTRGAGAGLANMNERVAALRGSLTIESGIGRGMQIRGRIPLVTQP
jgi:signal transduction histidine kinase